MDARVLWEDEAFLDKPQAARGTTERLAGVTSRSASTSAANGGGNYFAALEADALRTEEVQMSTSPRVNCLSASTRLICESMAKSRVLIRRKVAMSYTPPTMSIFLPA